MNVKQTTAEQIEALLKGNIYDLDQEGLPKVQFSDLIMLNKITQSYIDNVKKDCTFTPKFKIQESNLATELQDALSKKNSIESQFVSIVNNFMTELNSFAESAENLCQLIKKCNDTKD